MKKNINTMILEFFNAHYITYPFLKETIKNFVLINNIHKYVMDNGKYCTVETISRKWREIRVMSEKRLIDNKYYKIIRCNGKELYAISKMVTNSIYDTWEFTKL